jgi:hypothetical protein
LGPALAGGDHYDGKPLYEIPDAGAVVNPLVIPNGLSADLLAPPEPEAVAALRARIRGRTVVSKVVRRHPDKRWIWAIETVGTVKQPGWRPLLIACGGLEAHGAEVLATAAHAGLRVVERGFPERGVRGLLASLEGLDAAEVVNLQSPLDPDGSRPEAPHAPVAADEGDGGANRAKTDSVGEVNNARKGVLHTMFEGQRDQGHCPGEPRFRGV